MDPQIAELPAVQRVLLAWHREHGMRAPWRESRDPYQALVAAVMAQQTQMSRVLPAYGGFIAAFPTLESLAGASRADVIRAWAGMGYNQRAIRLHHAARIITERGWPRDTHALAQIDGIGPFTAAIIASFAFSDAAACVDTNVRRVLGRLAGDERLGGAALQRLADASMTPDEPARWNQALMDYGASVCTPRPKCPQCVVARWCAWRTQNETVSFNDSGDRPAVAEARASYAAKPRRARRPATAYEGSTRYHRGRIIDVLRGLPPGGAVRIDALASRVADGRPAPGADATRALVGALVREGLAAVAEGEDGARVSLPED